MSPDLDQIRREFMRFAPAYAEAEAEAALEKVIQLQSQGLARSGLYYLVLVDLVGSTSYMAEHGNEAGADRIERFVTAAISAISEIRLENTAVPLETIGDAVLIIFQCFPDILRWQAALEGCLVAGALAGEKPIEVRTCVSIGDVILRGVNPIALAVSQVFKFEKAVAANDIVLSTPAYHAAWPTLARAYHAFESQGEVALEGYPEPTMLYRLRREIVCSLDDFLKEETSIESTDSDLPR
jgi:class 3 adenylate cyclase